MSRHFLQRASDNDNPAATTVNLDRLPTELHLQIIYSLNPEDILALRQTCKYFVRLTHEPRLWSVVYYRMLETHPLGCSQSEFAALSFSQSEGLLVRASRTQKYFQNSRCVQHHIIPHGQMRKKTPLATLAFLSERFLLSVDDTTVVYVWDVSKLASSVEAPSFPCARLTLVGWRFETYSVTADLSTLYVILSTNTRAHVFSLPLGSSISDTDESNLSFRDEAYFDTHLCEIKSMDAEMHIAILEASDTSIVVVDWRRKIRSGFALLQDTTGMLPANYILALLVCGPYMLCFRHWSIDAYPIPHRLLSPALAVEESLPNLQHAMLNLRFTPSLGISFSRVYHHHSSSSNSYTICVLAKEARRRGIFHYQVHVQTTPEPALSVRLLGFNDAPVDQPINAWDLGPSGLRGAWVRMPTVNGERDVVTFTTLPYLNLDPDRSLFSFASLFESFPTEQGNLDIDPAEAPRMDERVVAAVPSSELDDDVTACVVSEFTGRIALGSRTGVITLL